MKQEIQKVIDAWAVLAKEINKFKPDENLIKLNPNYEPFKITSINGEYILQIDLGVFDEKNIINNDKNSNTILW